MTFALLLTAMKAASTRTTFLFQWQKGRKKSRLVTINILALITFGLSSLHGGNGFTIQEALFTGATGEGATKELDKLYTLPQEGLGIPFTEEHHKNADSIPLTEDFEEEEEESSDSDDDGENMPPLSPTVEKFDEAMNRACSPAMRDSILKNLENSVAQAMGIVDRWMNGVLGAMTTLESDSTALYEYLAGTGSLAAVIKGSCLFGLSILAGIITVFVYILCCLPKLCCKCMRRLCCCAKCGFGQFKLCSRLVKSIVLAVVTLSGIVFACLVLNYQKQGVQGAKQLYCQAYTFTDEILRGSALLGANDTQVDAQLSDEFEGLLPLIESVESLALLVDGTNPKNIVELSKQVATNALDVAPLADYMNGDIDFLSSSCVSFNANNSLSGGFHKSVWCDIRKSQGSNSGLISIENQMSSSARKIIEMNPKKYVETLFKKVTLPDLNVEASFPTESVKKLFFTVFDVLGDAEETISRVLGWLEVALCVDCVIYLAILLLVVLWAVWFFCRGNKAKSVIPAIFWNILTWVAVVFLVVGGALGWTTTLGRQGCSILINNCLEQDNWELLSDYAPVVEPLISQCLTKGGDGDLLAGVGVDAAYDQMLGALQETLNGFPANISPLDKETSELAENYLSKATSFGSLVAADPDSVAESRREVFPEFLKSGIQLADADIGGQTLYGLETLERLVAPWKLLALHPDEPADGEFIVRGDNPNEADAHFVRWLESLKERKMKELTENGLDEQQAEIQSNRLKVWTKNGIWWLQQKQKILELKFKCRKQDGTAEICGYTEMFGLKENELHASCMYNNQRDAAQSLSDSIGKINEKVIYPLEHLKKSLNCRFLRRNVVQMAAVACESTISNFYYVAIYRALGGGIACLIVVALLMLWISLKGGKSPKSLAGSDA